MNKRHYTIVSTQRRGLFGPKPTLLAAVPDESTVGGWLDEYSQSSNDRAFANIEIREVLPEQGETVIHNDPHRFIDRHRNDLHRAETESRVIIDMLQQAA